MTSRKYDDRRGTTADRRITRLRRMLEGYQERQAKNPNNKYIESEVVALTWAIETLEQTQPIQSKQPKPLS